MTIFNRCVTIAWLRAACRIANPAGLGGHFASPFRPIPGWRSCVPDWLGRRICNFGRRPGRFDRLDISSQGDPMTDQEIRSNLANTCACVARTLLLIEEGVTDETLEPGTLTPEERELAVTFRAKNYEAGAALLALCHRLRGDQVKT